MKSLYCHKTSGDLLAIGINRTTRDLKKTDYKKVQQ